MNSYDFDSSVTISHECTQRLLPKLVEASMLFAVMPLPDDEYRVMFRGENAGRVGVFVQEAQFPADARSVVEQTAENFGFADRTTINVLAAFLEERGLADAFKRFVVKRECEPQV